MNIFEQRAKQLLAQPKQKVPAHYFQDRALAAVKELGIDSKSVGSIMRHFKRQPQKAEAVYRNMLGKKFTDAAKYFHKLMSL